MKFMLCFMYCVFISIFSFSQAGTLDKTFGNKGKVYTDLNAYCYAAALQPDGKILAGGGHAYTLVRYLPDGVIDSSFGDHGFTSVTGFSAIKAIDVLDDGKILTGGTSLLQIAAARFKPDGTLDSTFGNDGFIAMYVGGLNSIFDMAVQADGKILLAGWTKESEESSFNMLMTRLNTDGTLDESFAQNGSIVNPSGAQFNCLALQNDGKILAGGQLWPEGHGDEDMFSISRYNTDGGLDESFGTNGTVLTDISNANDVPYSISVLNDGKILVAGKAHFAGIGDSYMTVVKYNNNGSVDESFGDAGVSNIILNDTSSYATGLLVQQDNKIVLTGTIVSSNNEDFALVRLNSNGGRDPSFGINGIVISDFGGYESAHASILQTDGKIILAGEDPDSHYDWLLARYNNDAAMPLYFTYFNAAPTNNGGVALNWQTVQENNNAYFAVERTPGNNFNELTRINSKGNSSQAQSYSYTGNP